MLSNRYVVISLICLLLSSISIVNAQEEQPDGPVYIVQAGDSLWAIAQRFGVSMDDLASKNGLADPGQLAIGAQLVIPGLEGISGFLVTDTVPMGESLESLSRKYGITQDALERLNHITSPTEVYAGSTLIIPQLGTDEQSPSGGRATLKIGQSPMELSISQGINPWALLQENQLNFASGVIPGETLFVPSDDVSILGGVPDAITALTVNPLPLVQGNTLEMRLSAPNLTSLSGQFHDQTLNFFQLPEGDFVAMQGIYALLEPGIYPLKLEGEILDGTATGFTQYVYVQDGNYPFDPPLIVDTETTDIENNETENALWADVVKPVTPEKYWQGIFQSPVPEVYSECFPSQFGYRRSYNESGYFFFHSGLDFCGGVGVDIYAPAPGKVVFIDLLKIRGNATVIDHGWGVYSAYGHQSEILVSVGDFVETGQLIGKVGETGRVTGPHLHWEIIVGGIQVDPLPWLLQENP